MNRIRASLAAIFTIRKPQPLINCLLVALIAAWQVCQPLQAATVYLDNNGTTAESGLVGPVIVNWDGSTTIWGDMAGTLLPVAWIAGDTAAFSAGADATGTITVTVSGAQSIGGLIFEEANTIITGDTLTLAANSTLDLTSATATADIQSNIDAATTARTITLTGVAGSMGTISGNISQSGTAVDLLVNGGEWALTGTNQIADDIIVSGADTVLKLNATGTIALLDGLYSRTNSTIRLGANDVNGVNNSATVNYIILGDNTSGATGNLDLNGFSMEAPRLDLGDREYDRTGNVTGAGTLTVTTNLNLYQGAISSNLAGAGAILKQGLGTVTLSGNNSGLNGTTNSRLDMGTLVLDYTNDTNAKISTMSDIDFRGGILKILGNAGSALSMTLPTQALMNQTGSNRIDLLTPGAGFTLNLGDITRASAASDGTLRISTASGGVVTTTRANDATGILGGWATINAGSGTFFAKNDGANTVVAEASTTKDDITTWLQGEHVTDSTGFTGTLVNDLAVGSIRFDADAASTVTVGAGNQLNVLSGGILQTGNVTAGASTITGGRLVSSTGELIFTTDSATQPLVVESLITGSTALTKTGTGTLRISGSGNTMSGTVTIHEGTLQVSGGNALGNASRVLFSLGNVSKLEILDHEVVGYLEGGLADLTAQGVATIDLGTGAGARVLTVLQSTEATFGGKFVGEGSLVKGGATQLLLNSNGGGGTESATSTHTGGTFVTRNAVELSALGRFTGSGTVTVGGGGIFRLHNTSSTSSQTDRLVNGQNIILRGGTFDFSNNANTSTSYSETVGSLLIQKGANTVIVDQAASGRTSALTFDGTNPDMARTSGSVVFFNSNVAGALGASTRSRIRIAAGVTLNNGIIGGWAFANGGNDFASYSNPSGTGSDTVFHLGITPPSGTLVDYSTDLATTSWTTATNVFYDTLAAQTLAADTTVNSLKITSTGGANSLDLGGFKLIVDAGGILYSGTGTNAFTGFTNGTLTAQGGSTVAPDLVFHLNNAADTVTVSAGVIDGAGGATGLTKSGNGTLILSGTNSFTGATAVVGGTLSVTDDAGLGTAPLSPTAAGLMLYGGTLEVTGAGVQTLDANRLIEIGGGSAGLTAAAGTNLTYNGAITTSTNTAANIPDWAALTVAGRVNSAFSDSLLVGGDVTWDGSTEGASTVVLSGTDNFIGGSLRMGRNGGEVNMSYTTSGGKLSIGTLDPTATVIVIGDRTGTANTGASVGTLDLTGSQDFEFQGATIVIGRNNAGTAAGNVTTGTLTIGENSNIFASNRIELGNNSSDSNGVATGSLVLGSGLNTVVTNLWLVGALRDSSGSVTIASGGTLNMRGLGVSDGLLRIAYNNANVSDESVGVFDMTGGTVIADLGDVTVGYKSSSGNGGATGTLTLGTSAQNDFRAVNVILGDYRGSGSNGWNADSLTKGTWNVGGGSVAIANDVIVGNHQGSNNNLREAEGVANFAGGTISVGNDLIVGRAAVTSGTAAHQSRGDVNIGAATLNVLNDLIIGANITTSDGPYGGTGTVILNDAGSVVTVGEDVMLGQIDGASIAITAKGTLKVNAGTLTVTGNIDRPVTGGAAFTQSQGFVQVDGGTLDLTGGTVFASSLSLFSGTISNVGAGGVTLDAGDTTDSSGIGGALGDALILKDTAVAFNVNLTGTTASNIHYIAGTTGGTISGDVDMGSVDRNINVEDSAATEDLTISGEVSGSANVVKQGDGRLLLSGANTGTGSLTVLAGTVAVGNANALGTAGSNLVTVGAGAFLNVNGFGAAIGGLSGAGTVQNANASAGTLTIGGGDAASTFSGAVTDGTGGGALSLVKTGAGTIDLTGGSALDYTGTTTVSGGVLNAGLRGTSALTVAAGAELALIDGQLVTLTLNGTPAALNLAAGATLGFEVGTTADLIQVATGGTALVGGAVTLDIIGLTGLAAGTYDLLKADSGLLNTGGSAGSYVLGNTPSGFTFALNQTDALVQLVIDTLTGHYWQGDLSSSWLTNNGTNLTNWADDANGTVDKDSTPMAGDTVIFSTTNAAFTSGSSIDTTLDGAVVVRRLQFLGQPAGITDVSIAAGTGGTLTITATAVAGTDGISAGVGSGNILISAPVILGGSIAQTWFVAATNTSLTVTGDITGGNRITKTGDGTLSLGGDNSLFSGGVTLNAGTLNVNSATALGTGNFIIGGGILDNGSGSALTLTSNANQSWNGDFTFAGSNDLTFGSGVITLGGNRTITSNGAGILALPGQMTGAFSLTKEGPGTLALAGLGSDYSGGSIVNAGTLAAVVPAALAAGTPLGSGAVILNGGTLALRGDGVGNDGTIAIGNAVNVAASAIVDVDRLTANTGNTIAMGGVTLASGVTLTLNSANGYGLSFTSGTLDGNATLSIAAGTLAMGAVGDGGHGFALTKDGAGTLALNEASTFSGGVVQNTGIISLGNKAGLGSGDYTVFGASTLNFSADFSGANGPVANNIVLLDNLTLTGADDVDLSGTVTNSGNSRTITNDSSGTVTFDGTINLSESATARSLTFSGTGDTVIDGTIENGGGSSSTLIKTGTGTLTLNSSNNHTGSTTSLVQLSGGTLILGNSGALGGNDRNLRVVTTASTLQANTDLTGANAISNTIRLETTLTVSGTESIEFNGVLTNYGGGRTLRNDLLNGKLFILQDVDLSESTTAGRTMTFRGTGTTLIEGTVDNNSTNVVTSNLTKNDSGTLIFAGNARYDGTTTITAGVLQIGNGGTTGNLDSDGTPGDVINNATLRFNRTNNMTVGNAISGSGNVEQVGAGGVTTLTGANTYSGVTTISAGTLQFAKQTSLYNNVTTNWTDTKLIVGTGATAAFNVGGAGEFTSSDIAIIQSLGTASGGFQDGSNIGLDTTNAGGAFNYSTVIADTHSGANSVGLTKLGSGTLVVDQANTYSGGTSVTGGTLEVNNASGSGTGSGSVIVSGAGTKLSGSGSIAGSTIIGSGGVLAPGVGNTASSNQTLVFTAASTAVQVQDGGQIQLGLTSSSQIDGSFDWTTTDALSYLNTAGGTGSTEYTTIWALSGDYDSIRLTNGTFDLGVTAGGTIKLSDSGTTAYTVGSIFKLLDWSTVGAADSLLAGSGGFTLTDLDFSAVTLGAGLVFDTTAFTTYGVVVVVPEPSRVLLLMLGLLGLMLRRRRR